jgi:hypothetical protein
MNWPKRGVYDFSERTGGHLSQTTEVPSDALLAREGESVAVRVGELSQEVHKRCNSNITLQLRRSERHKSSLWWQGL